MKASELSSVLLAVARIVEPGKPRDSLRYLSSALSQLPSSKTAQAALTELSSRLENAKAASAGDVSFSDLKSSALPLSLLVRSGGSKGAKDTFVVLDTIIERHGAKAVKVSEELLAPLAPARDKKAAAQPNPGVVTKHVQALTVAKAGTDEFTNALAALTAELDTKSVSVTDLKAIASELKVPRPGATRVKLLGAIAREHETILETLRKVNSGANAA